MTIHPFANNLRFVRQLREYTQQDMSELLHISRQTYNHYENGKRSPDLDMLWMISHELEVPSEYFLSGNPVFLNLYLPEVLELLKIVPLLTPDLRRNVLICARQYLKESSYTPV